MLHSFIIPLFSLDVRPRSSLKSSLTHSLTHSLDLDLLVLRHLLRLLGARDAEHAVLVLGIHLGETANVVVCSTVRGECQPFVCNFFLM